MEDRFDGEGTTKLSAREVNVSSRFGAVLGERRDDAEGVLRADEPARLVLHLLGGQEALEDPLVAGE